MQFFFWLILLMLLGVFVFTVQNSAAPLITMKFLIWTFETSLINIILVFLVVGVLMSLFFWVPKAIKASMRTKDLRRKIKTLETQQQNRTSLREERNSHQES
jgi:putative membrane protein